MIIVIIAGGSGTRLWPLSQSNFPKHLLRLTGEKSLLQNTAERARQLTQDIYVITEQSHAPEVAAQLPDLDESHIIVEPGRRGTASCIVLALATIEAKHHADEPIVFLHADAHIKNEDAFSKTVRSAAEVSQTFNHITLIGVEPTYAATGFGYIERGDKVPDEKEIYKVRSFKEKPDAVTAKTYFKRGNYYWNMGLFAAPASVFQKSFKENAPDLAEAYAQVKGAITDYDKLSDTYLSLPNKPIDTALIEKDPNLLVVPGTFDWMDIGSFFDLHKILQNRDKNSLKGDVELIESEDVMIHSTTDRPIVAIGLSGVVVVDSPDGLLVCAKDKSQLVGDAAKKLAARAKADTASAKPEHHQ